MSGTRLPPGLDRLPAPTPPGAVRVLVLDGERATAARLAALGYATATTDTAAGDLARFNRGTFDAVVLVDVLAAVADDQGLLDEAARVLRPGGTLVVRVPYRGLLGWLDADNLGRYLSEITGRGPRPSELHVIGWRRHYRRRELQAMLGPARFRVRAVAGTGLGLAQAARLLVVLLFRLLWPRETLVRRWGGTADAIGRVEDHLSVGAFAADLILVAERLPHDAPP